MNRRALIHGLAYAMLVILFKLYILLGGYSFTTFGFYFANVTAAALIIPFYYSAIRGVRDGENNGVISGREAMRVALTVFAVGALLISFYHYAEFELKAKSLAMEYYRSEQFLTFLKKQTRITPDQYESIIEEQIRTADTAGFKATTAKLFSFVVIGGCAAFITSALMKRRSARVAGQRP